MFEEQKYILNYRIIFMLHHLISNHSKIEFYKYILENRGKINQVVDNIILELSPLTINDLSSLNDDFLEDKNF